MCEIPCLFYFVLAFFATILTARVAVVLEIDNLKRHYRMGASVVRALDGVSLSVNEGEFVGLLDRKSVV